MSWSESVKVRLKYLDQHIEYMEKELVGSRKYRETLVRELQWAEEKELQDVHPHR